MKETKFKQTEIGLIPEDWEVKKIGELCCVNTGSRNTQDKVDNGAYPFFVRSQQIENIDTYSYDCEAVLTAGDGVGTGKVFHYINGKFEVHQRVYLMNDFVESLNAKFFYWLFSQRFYDRVHSMTAKSSVDSVRKEMITEMCIPIPPLSEQSRIASALTSIDNLISSLDKLIAKKKLIKQGAMQELLTGKRRLKGYGEPWVEKRIGDIAIVGRGRVISNTEIHNSIMSLYPVYSSQTTNNGIMGYIDSYDFDGEYVTWTTDGVNAGTVFYRDGKFNCTNVCGTLLIKDYCTRFVAFALGLRTPLYVSTNLANPKLMNGVMKSITIVIPSSLSEQSSIASILTSMDGEISMLEVRRVKYEAVKRGMMQELLTGRVRMK